MTKMSRKSRLIQFIFLILFLPKFLNASPTVTQIYPHSGTNDGIKNVTIHGSDFATGMTIKLKRTGESDIVASNVFVYNVYMSTCTFDLTGKAAKCWDVFVDVSGSTATLKMAFTINQKINPSEEWNKENVGFDSLQIWRGLGVGDGNNDGNLEVYGAGNHSHIYQFKWDGLSWTKTDVGSGGATTGSVVIGDGNNDGDLEVYGSCSDFHIYQFKWNGANWTKTDVGSGGSFMHRVAVGDGNNDGDLEVYGVNQDHHIYQFKWNGISWTKTDLGSGGDGMYGLAVGDGNNDGDLEVYGANDDFHMYQFKWNGISWEKTDVGSGPSYINDASVGDGNNDGDLEVYGTCSDFHIYQFKWNGISWEKTDVGSGDNQMWKLVVGDGNNDGDLEVYGVNDDHHLYQFKWNGTNWEKTDVGSGANSLEGIAVGDGNHDGGLEVYGAGWDKKVDQFKVNSDTTPPSDITDFSASTGTFPGEIDLSWTAPGDDGNTGDITNGQYHIKYSSETAHTWDNMPYEIQWSTNTSPGNNENKIITGLIEGTTYYFYIKTADADEVPNWSGLSNKTTTWAQVTILSISLDSSAYDFGTVIKNSTNVATSSITVTNDGNVSERYYLNLTAPAGWTYVTDTAPGAEEFRMCGNFQTATAQTSHFDIGGSFSDAIGTTQRVCSSGDFAKDDEGETAKGYNVPSGQNRYLWFRFESPTSTALTTQQTITVTITAEEQP